MSLMKSGLTMQASGLQGMMESASRQSSRDIFRRKMKSDATQSAISTAASSAGLLLRGAVEAKKRGWFDDVGSILEDVF